jgi:hypothetical protein
MVEREGHRRMARTERAAVDRRGTLIEVFFIAKTALEAFGLGKHHEHVGHPDGVESELAFADRESPDQPPPRHDRRDVEDVDPGDTDKPGRDAEVIWPEVLFSDLDGEG